MINNSQNSKRLVVVSNRLPIILQKEENHWKAQPGMGGLVSAFSPILKRSKGSWIGWLGTTEKISSNNLLTTFQEEQGYHLHPIELSKKELEGYYKGFANEILWPLFHNFETRCHFVQDYWQIYCDANIKFANTIAEKTSPSDYIWVQDYHLMMVAHYLKQLDSKRTVSFFLHIPFPSPDIFLKLPWRKQILRGLLEYDIIGTHTTNDRDNLIESIKKVLFNDIIVTGEGSIKTITIKNHKKPLIKIGAFPISIDDKFYESITKTPEALAATQRIRNALTGQQIILGVDRLDYTKGIPERIEAFGLALKTFPELRGHLTLIQSVVPSRTEVTEYKKLKKRVEALVSEVNGEFGIPGWTPIQYFYRTLPIEELVSYYNAADIALVTPLKDGMNLIAKEYCLCKNDNNGVLILSEFAGAAQELSEAIIVNPYNIHETAAAIYRAFMMKSEERSRRMTLLTEQIKEHNLFFWAENFLHEKI